MRAMRCWKPCRRVALLLAALAGCCSSPLSAQTAHWGGSLRGYQFFRLEDLPPQLAGTRRDLEFGSLRLTWEQPQASHLKWEVHAVLEILSPPFEEAAGVATGRSNDFLPLQSVWAEDDGYRLEGRFDRLNLQMELGRVRVTAGRQAITWGVAYFWPTLDLFSPFSPQRIDRDYKAGVDAVRATVALGRYSEVQIVAASLGPAVSRDGALAAQFRFHLGRLDLGFVGGKSHGDSVAGVFFTGDLQGTALRGEVAWTDSDDPLERSLDRGAFWRATLGIDRQITPDWGLTLELAYNGFGVGSAQQYLALSNTDRVRRGELFSLGTYYAGAALTWQLHPLWTFTQSLLFNAQDASALWIPALAWSTSDNSSLLLAVQTGFGSSLRPDLSPNSEYGPVPTTAFAAFTWYF